MNVLRSQRHTKKIEHQSTERQKIPEHQTTERQKSTRRERRRTNQKITRERERGEIRRSFRIINDNTCWYLCTRAEGKKKKTIKPPERLTTTRA